MDNMDSFDLDEDDDDDSLDIPATPPRKVRPPPFILAYPYPVSLLVLSFLKDPLSGSSSITINVPSSLSHAIGVCA